MFSRLEEDKRDLLSKLLFSELLERFKHWMCTNIFYSPNMLSEMDHDSSLTLSAIKTVRRIEENHESFRHQHIFPSRTSMNDCAATVEAYADTICPFVWQKVEGIGELVNWNCAQLISVVLKAYKLDNVATRRLGLITPSSDGTQVTHHTNMTFTGFKVADKAARDPRTGNVIFGSNLQSRNHCFAVQTMLAGETKESVEKYVKPTLADMFKLSKEGFEEFPYWHKL